MCEIPVRIDRPVDQLILEQSTEELMAYGMLTPHLEGMLAAFPALIPLMRPTKLLRQPHAARLSAVVLAAPARLLTPLQQPADGPAPPRA